MKTLLKVLCLSLSVILSQSAANGFANGGIGDGGGQGIVCRNDEGTVISAQLLDLAEAQFYYLLPLQAQPISRPYLEIAHDYAKILTTAIPQVFPTAMMTSQSGNQPPKVSYELNPGILPAKGRTWDAFRDAVDAMDKNKMILPGTTMKIPPVNDSHPRILPAAKNCGIEQIAVYMDGTNKVRFVGNVWDALDNTNKAALLIHEALYRNLRMLGDVDSDRTRKVVAHLFSGLQMQSVVQDLPNDYLFCWTMEAKPSFQFAVYPLNDQYVTANFLVYDGEVMLTQTLGTMNLAPFASAFKMPVTSIGNISTQRQLTNPLLETPYYVFTVQTDSTIGKMSMFMKATKAQGNESEKPIACQSFLSHYEISDDGSVSVGPSQN